MKKFLLLLLAIAIASWGIGLFWWRQVSQPVWLNAPLKDFLILKGSSATEIGNKLYQEGFIKSSLAFKFYVQLKGSSEKIQAGEYRLSPGFSLAKIVEELSKGPAEIWVTIPEGLRREEIALKFASVFGKGEEFIQEFLDSSKRKEGFLFPDTYLFPKTASPSLVVNKMLTTFDKKLDSQMEKDIEASGYSPTEVITMASTIERETAGLEERPTVSGILYKRLGNNWPLQADASVQYAKASAQCLIPSFLNCEWWPVLTKEDLEINSNFNTYKFKGLPPAPIANPGLSAIKAAIYPKDSPYWFYLHDSSGKVYFAKTLGEHNENIRRYLQ